jgi:hypothetical protein
LRLDSGSIENFTTVVEQLKSSGKLAKPVDWQKFIYPDLLKAASPATVDFKFPQ